MPPHDARERVGPGLPTPGLAAIQRRIPRAGAREARRPHRRRLRHGGHQSGTRRQRLDGHDECLAGWQGLATDPSSRFAVEHVDVDGERAVIRWRVTCAQNYRGVNLMRVRDGKIVEALGDGKRPGVAREREPEETSDAHCQRQRGRPRHRVLRRRRRTTRLAGGRERRLLSWPDALCERLAAGGRRVVRYDLATAAQSTTVNPNAPAYTLPAWPPGAPRDALRGRPAHLAGIGVGGMVAQLIAWFVEPQAGRRLSFRICLSNAQAGTKRRRALTRRAVGPAAYRSLGFGSVAAATIDLATVAGSSRAPSHSPPRGRTAAAAPRRPAAVRRPARRSRRSRSWCTPARRGAPGRRAPGPRGPPTRSNPRSRAWSRRRWPCTGRGRARARTRC